MKHNPQKLILFGADGHCRSVVDSIRPNQFSEIVILDKNETLIGSEIGGIPIVGNDDARTGLLDQGFSHAFITLGGTSSTQIRSQIAAKLAAEGFEFPIIRDPSAIVSTSARIGAGTFIAKGVIVNSGAKIGEHAILNSGCIIEHDCEIGAYCHIAPGACLSGQVRFQAQDFTGSLG